MPFGGLWANQSRGCLTLARATSFKLGRQSPPLVKKKSFSSFEERGLESNGPRACVRLCGGANDCTCLRWKGGRRLIFVAPVTCHRFCHKQLPRWIRRERRRCIVAECFPFFSFIFYCPNGRRQACAERCRDVVTRCWFKKTRGADWWFPPISPLHIFHRFFTNSRHCYNSPPPSQCPHIRPFPCIVWRAVGRRRSRTMNKSEQSNSVLQPPASPMNKHTDTSLNMPRGSYHIQLSSGCWYIVRVLCSHSDTVTSRNKSLMCPNVSGVHRFLCFLNLQGENFHTTQNLSLASFSHPNTFIRCVGLKVYVSPL